jgi:hypothetical protein
MMKLHTPRSASGGEGFVGRACFTSAWPSLFLGCALFSCALEGAQPPLPGPSGGTGGTAPSAGQGGAGTGGASKAGTGGTAAVGGSGGAAGANVSSGGTGGGLGGGAGSGAGGMSAGAGGAAGNGAAGGGAGGLSGAAGSSAGAGGAQAGMGGSGAGAAGAAGGNGGPSLPPITDYEAQGPFSTTVDMDVGPDEAYTVYRPTTLGEDGFLHAPIVFGPGIGQSVTVHTTMLTNFASHGFVVVGTPVLEGGPGDDGNLDKMEAGLDWIIAQNGMPGMYQGKLWIDHAISMGFSVGGTSAVELGGHEAVATVVSIHGHTATAALHGPMLQTTGTLDTVGMPLQQNTYNTSQVQTFLATLTGANHPYIERDGGGEERPAILAWMRYWIYGDMGARDFFFGEDCVLCKAPWENPQRKNWQ